MFCKFRTLVIVLYPPSSPPIKKSTENASVSLNGTKSALLSFRVVRFETKGYKKVLNVRHRCSQVLL